MSHSTLSFPVCQWPHSVRHCRNKAELTIAIYSTLGVTILLSVLVLFVMRRKKRQHMEITQETSGNEEAAVMQNERHYFDDAPNYMQLRLFFMWIWAFIITRIISIVVFLKVRLESSASNQLIFHIPQCFYIAALTAYLLSRTNLVKYGVVFHTALGPALYCIPFVVIVSLSTLIGHYHDLHEHEIELIATRLLWAVYALIAACFGAWFLTSAWNRSVSLIDRLHSVKLTPYISPSAIKSMQKRVRMIARIIWAQGVLQSVLAFMFSTVCVLMIIFDPEEQKSMISVSVVNAVAIGVLSPVFLTCALALTAFKKQASINCPKEKNLTLSNTRSTESDNMLAVFPQTPNSDFKFTLPSKQPVQPFRYNA